ncbi:MAG: hypothetical protein HRU14_00560 [Planctomycetes bacterium]|jgi:hypothetical protein|nr:hypothetical protein [Planctomycetota bacterium]
MTAPRILYCHCAYAKVVPEETKQEVLGRLSASGLPFEAVTDLCEMAARKDPALERLADGGPTKIAACFPRAVKWLFFGAGFPISDDGVEVLNMREAPADEIVSGLLGEVEV